jgi:hypothetical protein
MRRNPMKCLNSNTIVPTNQIVGTKLKTIRGEIEFELVLVFSVVLGGATINTVLSATVLGCRTTTGSKLEFATASGGTKLSEAFF